MLLKNDERNGPGIGAFVAEIAAQIVLGILASIIVMWFSRQREFRADAGGANLAGRQKMIAALERLKMNHEQAAMPQKMAAMAISSQGGFSRLFMTHPPLDERIEALRSASLMVYRTEQSARLQEFKPLAHASNSGGHFIAMSGIHRGCSGSTGFRHCFIKRACLSNIHQCRSSPWDNQVRKTSPDYCGAVCMDARACFRNNR